MKMRSVSRMALGVTLLFGATAMFVAAPAGAQKKKKKEEAAAAAAAAANSFQGTKEERAALVPVQTAITAKDWAAAQAALPAAVAAAQSPDALYAIARFKL